MPSPNTTASIYFSFPADISLRERTRLKLTLRGKRLGLTLSEIKDLVDMYESPKDTEAQLQRFMAVLAQHRELLERQREDIEITLAEIDAHEAECKRLLGDGKTAKSKSAAKVDDGEGRRTPATRAKAAV